MYLCNYCKEEFENPIEVPIMSGEYWGTSFTQYGNGCPCCKSGEIFEIKNHCDICNCSIVEGDTYYESENGGIFCENCIIKKEA